MDHTFSSEALGKSMEGITWWVTARWEDIIFKDVGNGHSWCSFRNKVSRFQREGEKWLRERERKQGPLISYSTYLKNILPTSSQLKLEISMLSFYQGSHSPPGCLFLASKQSIDVVNNFLSWKFSHCKSSGPIWLILNLMGWLVVIYEHMT